MEQMSECRRSGSNYHLSSQSRKISIGVMVDSSPRRKPMSTKGDENALPRVEKFNSATENDLDTNKKHERIPATKGRNESNATEHVSSPSRTPRSSHRKLGTLNNVLCSFSGRKGLQKDVNGVNRAPPIESLQQFPTSNFQSGNDKLNFGQCKKGKDGSQERVEESASAAAQEKIVSGGLVEDKIDKAENRSTEALRNKLYEILGTVSSPRNHHSDSRSPEVRDKGLNLDQNNDPEGDKFAKPRINSYANEIDSESPEIDTRRPETRSLLQKKATIRAAQKTIKSGAYSSHKHKEQEKPIFSCEGLLGKTTAAVNVRSVPKNKKARRETPVSQCRKFHSPEQNEAEEVQKETRKSKTLPPRNNVETDKTSSISHKQGSAVGFPPQNRVLFQKPQNGTMEEDFHQSRARKRAKKRGRSFHGLSENEEKLEAEDNPFFKKAVDPQDDFQSPTFGFRTPVSRPSLSSSPQTNPMHPSDNSPAPEEVEPLVFSFGTKRDSEAACSGSNAERELSDVLEKSRDYSFRRGTSAKQNNDSGLSESPSDERDSNGSGEDSPLMEHCNSSSRRKETSPQGSHKKSKLVSPSTETDSNPKGPRLYEPSPTWYSPKGVHETDCLLGSSRLNEDDGLGRAVALFALALQNFEKKLKSAARKKSSEILTSVSEGIKLQMENVEAYILTDVGKLSNITKTKRKHAETRFQEQQERLRMVHEKFRNDISHHLEDFKSTLEELEANRSELKGTIKKQKASHQQLITQLEGEVETQLVNAERRINAVNESARGKTLQLKRIVAECFKDDILD